VMIEAMACGTPVIARRCGSVPEVMHAETGFIVDDLADAVRAAQQVQGLSRKHCREIFEKKFTAARMAQDYLTAYKRIRSAEHESEEAV